MILFPAATAAPPPTAGASESLPTATAATATRAQEAVPAAAAGTAAGTHSKKSIHLTNVFRVWI